MTINTKAVRIILLATMLIASFYSLTGTSLFEFFANLSGSYFNAILIINLSAIVIIFLTVIAGVKLEKIVYVISLVFCFPAVMYHSKINWFQIIWGLKFYDSHPFVLTALTVIYSAVGAIFTGSTLKFESQGDDWIATGANKTDVAEIFKNRLEILIFVVGLISVPVFLIAILSSLINLPYNWAMGPVIIAIIGALLAAIAVYYFLSGDQKSN
ncbi:MAG: hypothetical protein Q8942_00940 [Bacillota bacterium]|nr:hypothetical protein [Bacillota bacterium]